tara:strand:+ start:2032 stop:3474 length:1443 start_codon:yes stop_codon:yes gene_type:complete
MANDKSSEKISKESVSQALNNLEASRVINNLRNGLNTVRKYIARTGDQGLTSLNQSSSRNPDFITSKRNEELANKVSIYYGYTVGEPRALNSVEKLEVDSKYNVAKSKTSELRYVKFYSNNTPCQAFPQMCKYPENSPQRLVLENIYPEALVDLEKLRASEISSGQIIQIEYLDKKNNLLPIVVSVLTDSSAVIDVNRPLSDSFSTGTTAGKPSQSIKNMFSKDQLRNVTELSNEQKFTGKDRDLDKIKHFVIHDTVSTTSEETINQIKSKGYGIHYVVSESGTLITTGEWKERLGHAGAYNSTSIGVEVVNPAYVSNLGGDTTWNDSLIKPAPWAWTEDYRNTKTFIVPTAKQMETVWNLCQIVTSPETGMKIPLEFIGLDKQQNTFVMTGRNPYSKLDKSKPGILAHSYLKHGDGAATVLYCFLRSTGMSPEESRLKMKFLLKPDNLIKKPATGSRKGVSYKYTEYYANLDLLKMGRS